MTKNDQSSLLLDLSSFPYVWQSILQDWFSLHDATRLISVCVPNTPGYANFFRKSHQINCHFLKNADISELKLLLRKGLQSESFLAHIDKKDLRETFLKALTHPNADLEYRLLALNFLSEHPFVLQLPPDLHNKPVDPFIFLLYSTTFSTIDSQVITEYFQQWLDDIEEDTSAQKKGLESAVCMLDLFAHKLARKKARRFVLRLFRCFKTIAWPTELKRALSLLSVLVIEYQAEDISEMIKWLTAIYHVGYYYQLSDVLKSIFSKFPSTFETIGRQTLLRDKRAHIRASTLKATPSLWPSLTFNDRKKLLETLLGILMYDVDENAHLEALKAVISLWFALEDSQREEVKDIALTILGDINSRALQPADLTALEAVLSLWHTFKDSQREQLKVIALQKLVLGNTLIDETCEYVWSAFNKPERATATAGIRVMEASALCWSDLNKIQRRNEMAKIFSDDGQLQSLHGVENALLRWFALDEVQRERVRETILTRINNGPDHHTNPASLLQEKLTVLLLMAPPLHVLFENDQHNRFKEMLLAWLNRVVIGENNVTLLIMVRNATKMAIALSHDLEPAQYETIMKSSFSLFKSRLNQTSEAGQQFIISCIPLLSAEQLTQTVEKLTKCLNSDNLDHRMRALDILMGIICRHPNHAYSFSALQDSPLKDYLSHAIDTIQAAQASHPQLRI